MDTKSANITSECVERPSSCQVIAFANPSAGDHRGRIFTKGGYEISSVENNHWLCQEKLHKQPIQNQIGSVWKN